jgi:hypothetical protein
MAASIGPTGLRQRTPVPTPALKRSSDGRSATAPASTNSVCSKAWPVRAAGWPLPFHAGHRHVVARPHQPVGQRHADVQELVAAHRGDRRRCGTAASPAPVARVAGEHRAAFRAQLEAPVRSSGRNPIQRTSVRWNGRLLPSSVKPPPNSMPMP